MNEIVFVSKSFKQIQIDTRHERKPRASGTIDHINTIDEILNSAVWQTLKEPNRVQVAQILLEPSRIHTQRGRVIKIEIDGSIGHLLLPCSSGRCRRRRIIDAGEILDKHAGRMQRAQALVGLIVLEISDELCARLEPLATERVDVVEELECAVRLADERFGD